MYVNIKHISYHFQLKKANLSIYLFIYLLLISQQLTK